MKKVNLTFLKNAPETVEQKIGLNVNVGNDGKSAYEMYLAVDGTLSEAEFNDALTKMPNAATIKEVTNEVNRAINAEQTLALQIADKVSSQGGETGNTVTTFTQFDNRINIVSGEKQTTLFGKIMKWFSDLKAVAFSGAYRDLSGIPTSLPANGGNAESAVKDGAGNVIENTYLSKTNTTEYTPTSDYNPVTKKYVDDIQVSSINIIDSSESITVDDTKGNNNMYKSLYIGEIVVGDQFALSINDITNINGSPDTYSAVLYESGGGGQISNRVTLSQNNKTAVIKAAASTKLSNGSLLLYAGEAGKTAGNVIQYDHVMLVRGNKPSLTWMPSTNDLATKKYVDDKLSELILQSNNLQR